MKFSAILVDDEKHGRENLAGLLREYCPEIELQGKAASVDEALHLINVQPPDLLFLDIQMPGKNGFQLLEHLQDFSFEVIFVTAFDNYAIKAIRFSAADYILKPVNHNDLVAAVNKAMKRIGQKQENLRLKELYNNLNTKTSPRIGLPAGDRIEYIDVNQIVRCQGEGNYTHIWFGDKKHQLVSKTLVEYEELLQDYNFIRVHKTHLVNLKHVVAYIKSSAVLKLSDNELIPVSRRRKEYVLERLKLLKQSPDKYPESDTSDKN